ncbi:MAG: DUF3160 domain-containing protein [Armatimonadetes bacterium]|nr:DUF3160 domain-containing protein [Armatimonadota bacterium]
MNTKHVWAVAILAGSISITDSTTLLAQQPATAETIAAPITTAFGIYSPYNLPTFRAELGRNEPAIAGEFTNVQTPDQLEWSQHFTQAERAMLRRNNILVRPEAMGTFAEAYFPENNDLPPFITTDAVLHGLRSTMMEAERRIERDQITPALRGTMERLAAAISIQLDRSSSGTPAYEANLRLLAWTQTAIQLIDPEVAPDPRVATVVKKQVEQIEHGTNTIESPIVIGAQMNPATFALASEQGFDEASSRLHRALAWLNSVGFAIAPDADPTTIRMAMILARTIETTDGNSLGLSFHDLSDLLAFFHGRSDQDVSPAMLGGALRGFYGTYGFASAGAGSNAEIQQFAEYFSEQAPAEIRGRNYQLVFLPRPASVNRTLLAQGEVGRLGTALIAGLSGNDGSSVSEAFRHRPAEHWAQDIDWITLYTLQSYVDTEELGEGFPRFMRSDAYRARLNLGALGAWGDFQHPSSVLPSATTAIAPRQTATATGTATRTAEGYVELRPRTWGRIASMAQYLRNGVADGRFGDLIGQDLTGKLRDIENSAAGLMNIASLTLAGQPLTTEQQELIAAMPGKIAAYETASDPTLSPKGMMIAAGAVNAKNLRIANGHPLAIYVILPSSNGQQPLTLARGAIYSYYETTTPAQEWTGTIVGNQRGPQAPAWTSGLISPDVNTAQDAATFRPVRATLRSVTAAYQPSLAERRSTAPTAQLELESNVVRRGDGALWFTIQAPRMNGAEVSLAVVNGNGQVIYRSSPVSIDNGQRFDMIPLENINNGSYFIRVIDTDSRTIASGRFMVTR